MSENVVGAAGQMGVGGSKDLSPLVPTQKPDLFGELINSELVGEKEK